MLKYGYLGSISESPLEFEITRVIYMSKTAKERRKTHMKSGFVLSIIVSLSVTGRLCSVIVSLPGK